MSNEQLLRTPLYNSHLKLGAKMVPFAGWEMPVQYAGVIAEHNEVRNGAGIFDVSHMGEIFVRGPEAERALNYLTCNDVSTLIDGKAQYSALTNHSGGVVDDIIIYRFSKDEFFVCVNASNTDKDYNWLVKENKFNAKIENVSSQYGQIAIQGPKAVAIAVKLFNDPTLKDIAYFHHAKRELFGTEIIVARTGYTGEDGFEFFIPAAATEKVWNALLELGATPAGLGARDSLRLESCYPLYGHELADDVSAVESGLSWIVKLKKGDFIGRKTIEAHMSKSPRSLVGFFVDDPGIARQHDKIFSTDGKEIGFVTSGTKTPFVNKALGMAVVDSSFSSPEQKILIEVRGKKLASHVTKKPFYKRRD